MRVNTRILLPLCALVHLVHADTEILVFEAGEIQALPTLPAHAAHAQRCAGQQDYWKCISTDIFSSSHAYLGLSKPLSLFATFDPEANSSYAEKAIQLDLGIPKVDNANAKLQTLWSLLHPKYMLRVSWPASVRPRPIQQLATERLTSA